MKKILLFGSGRSAPVLIEYLSDLARKNFLSLTIADFSLSDASLHEHIHTVAVHIDNELSRHRLIQDTDVVISLLPPSLHSIIAHDCLLYRKHFLTASYISPEIQQLDHATREQGLLFLMECGLDPGIDHMSAMRELENIKASGGTITSFKSYTGGLVAPESDDNPWNYKITWNPRNVVLAGQGTVKYLEGGAYKYIPYHRLFTTIEKIRVEGYGNFEGYANRDSLKYLHTYGLENTSTLLRGTLRRPGYCDAWNLLVQLGITDDSYIVENSETLTWKEFTLSFLPKSDKKINLQLAALINQGPGAREIAKLKWLGLLEDKKIGYPPATPAQLLQKLLEEKWRLQPEDKDMIVMQHLFEYTLNGKSHKRTSSLVMLGDNQINTAMAKTVGLPLAIAARLILEGKINLTGVHIPVMKEIYLPVLEELEKYDVRFINAEF
ncbi:MAG TPA: saccharopine dehydrogenase C-terminal domain-containing protein [Cytophagaceae bacterium]|nr:saccharopine dehydrogenase C-terminal domain-containing protein [Cytophagaceae bacterium]